MKHIAVFAALALAILFVVLRPSKLDKLMEPTTYYTESQVGNRFVDIDPARLPMKPGDLAVPGVITVVYFHDALCVGCRDLDKQLDPFLAARPDVAIRKVHIGPADNGYQEAIRNFRWKIYMAPCILLFDKRGKLIAADDATDSAGQDLLEEWMWRELNKGVKPG